VIEAMVLVTVAAGLQRWVPMPRWSGLLGRPAAVPAAWNGQRITRLPLRWANVPERRVTRAVRSACRVLPWEPRCLAEATAGQVLLRQLRSPGVVVIGLKPPAGEPADATTVRWDAHAWLLGAAGALTGGPAARGFTATSLFQVPGALAADEVNLTPGAPGAPRP
jgi:hypothetical protein